MYSTVLVLVPVPRTGTCFSTNTIHKIAVLVPSSFVVYRIRDQGKSQDSKISLWVLVPVLVLVYNSKINLSLRLHC